MPITVIKRDEGLFLIFSSKSNDHTMVSVEKVFAKGKDSTFINRVIQETCQEITEYSEAPACYKPSPVVERMTSEMEGILRNIRHLSLPVIHKALTEWVKALRGLR